ncbi:MAG: cytochrome c1 [Magnetovibrio sp.]|nr:cytochrome c1 [Magnetovibrio sp.]|tara:strand:+ start:929 stop:1717 length:789 start_codon:yes stop_codon:yes gene_type:complete
MRNILQKHLNLYFALAVVVFSFGAADSMAGGKAPKPPKQEWSFDGMFGTFDKAAAQRGFQVYQEVCAGCHSLRQIDFRHLAGIGYTEEQIKAFAAESEVTDGPDDEGEMFERSGIPADPLPSPFANDQAAAASNNGKVPPDLSLMNKARIGGADYVYALLTGYTDPPSGIEVPEGGSYNTYYPGHIIAMAAPLSDEGVEYQDGTKATVAQQANDVVTFLAWTAEPEMERRKSMGLKVLIFLFIFTALLYRVKKVVWKGAKLR